MAKVTKRPKRTTVYHQKTTSSYAIYTCPSCYVETTGAGISRDVTRFKCLHCGQELIITAHRERNKK